MLELSTTFRGISTAKMTPADAAGKAGANLRYITRESAALLLIEKRKGEAVKPLYRADLKKTLAHFRKETTKRSQEGGQNGRRVAEKIMFTVPNDWDSRTTIKAAAAVCRALAPADSDVELVAAIHTDKAKNKHIHILALDGEESREAAQARRPDAKRIRRQNVIRLSEKGGERCKELRAEIAHALNKVAAQHGVEGVEWRSFEERGIEREPSTHRGPEKPRLQAHHRAAVAAAEAAEQAKATKRKKAVRQAAQRLVKPTAPRQPQAERNRGVER